MKKLWEYKFQILALGIFLAAILSSRGGLAALAPLLKFIVPFVLMILFFNMIKRKFLGALGANFKEHLEKAMQQQQGMAGRGGRVDSEPIQLCSKCGSYATPNHKCK